MKNSSNDTTRDTKTRSIYLGLYKRLGSPEFILDLGLMYDVHKELSYLSQELQSHSITLLRADQSIKRAIRVIDSFKAEPGEYTLESLSAQTNMMFKNIMLFSNKKLNCINQNQFLTSICNNLRSRLLEPDEEGSNIIRDIQILNKNTWPSNVDVRFGENEIKILSSRFVINSDHAIRGFRKFIDNEMFNE